MRIRALRIEYEILLNLKYLQVCFRRSLFSEVYISV